MRRKKVDSEAILSIGYEERTRTLEVEFSGGGVYRYYGVPPGVYRRLLKADSIGRFASRHVREEYPYERVS